jgi:hypothetical protein
MRKPSQAEDSDDEVSAQDSDYSDDEESDQSLDGEDELDMEDILAKKKEQKYRDLSKMNYQAYKYHGDSRDLTQAPPDANKKIEIAIRKQ